MKMIAAFVSLFAAAPAFATSYTCSTPRNEVRAFLVFDDGPGGLDAANVTAWGQEYSDVIFDDTPKSIKELNSHDTSKGTYEYGGDKLEVALTSGSLTLEIFAKRTGVDKLAGKIVAQGAHSTTTLKLTCKED